jgi:hypothetical protein
VTKDIDEEEDVEEAIMSDRVGGSIVEIVVMLGTVLGTE